MTCEKQGLRESVDKNPGLKSEVFIVTEARGPWFLHVIGENGQIIFIARSMIDFCSFHSQEYGF